MDEAELPHGEPPQGENEPPPGERPRRAGRARKRAIRRQAARAGVPYSVASRQLDAGGFAVSEEPASTGRTVYPSCGDPYRRRWVQARASRTFQERLVDARLGAVLPSGRAAHLIERFPPTRGIPRSGVGQLYHGEGRLDTLAMIYRTVSHEAPGLVPSEGDLAWAAELGEETTVDTACADVDRAARRLLDDAYPMLCQRIHSALVAGERSPDWRVRRESARLRRLYEFMTDSFDETLPHHGLRQILDALLVVADDGHAPGTRVRLAGHFGAGQKATIVRVHWGHSGPPLGYDVQPDGASSIRSAVPEDLLVLPGQETLPLGESHGNGVHA